jgi:hypothetical protein
LAKARLYPKSITKFSLNPPNLRVYRIYLRMYHAHKLLRNFQAYYKADYWYTT